MWSMSQQSPSPDPTPALTLLTATRESLGLSDWCAVPMQVLAEVDRVSFSLAKAKAGVLAVRRELPTPVTDAKTLNVPPTSSPLSLLLGSLQRRDKKCICHRVPA